LSNKNKIINQAQKFIQKGQWDKAIKELQKLVAEDPNDVRTLLKLGDVYAKKGEREQATKVYKQVAESYGEQGFFLKAVAVYKQILKHDPKHLEVTFKLAELYEHLGLTSEAMAQYQVASQIQDETGNSKEALDVLRRMIELDADNVASRIKLAEGYSRENMISEAIQEFHRAGEILKRQNRIDDYIKVAERLVYHDPSRIDVIKELAQLYLKRNDTKRALAKLQLCFKAQPKDVETLTLLATAFRDLGQMQKTVFVYRELARIHQEQGREGEARATLQKILEVDPGDQEARSAMFGGNTGQMNAAMSSPFGSQPGPAPFAQASGMSSPFGSQPVSSPFGGSTASGFFSNTGGMSPPPARDSRSPPRSTSTQFQDPYSARSQPSSSLPPPPSDFAQSDGSDEILALDSNAGPLPDDEPYDQPGQALVPQSVVPRVDTVAVQKILTETDVYIKYGLRDKALEHLRKIFELDPDNVLAYTKMRDIYLGVGDTARAAEAIANLVHIHSRRGDVDALKGSRSDLERLAPGHPLIAGMAAAASYPGFRSEDVDSIDITENSDVFEADELHGAASMQAEPTDEIDGGGAAADSLDAWLQADPSDEASALDAGSLDPAEVFASNMQTESGRVQAQPQPPSPGEFESSFKSQFDFQEESSSVSVNEADIVAMSALGSQPHIEAPTFRRFEEESFEHEETDAMGLIQSAKSRAEARTEEPRSMLDEIAGVSSQLRSIVSKEDSFDAPFGSARLDTSSAPADVSDLSLDGTPAALPMDPYEDDLPEASSSQVVALDELDPARSGLKAGGSAHRLSGGLSADLEVGAHALSVRARAISEEDAEAEVRTGEVETDQHTEDELDEAEFLFGEGLVQEARDIVEGVLERLPQHSRAISLRAMLSSRPSPGDEEMTGDHAKRNGTSQDLSTANDGGFAVSDDDVASAFNQAQAAGPDDGESAEDHYDQGMANKEVGRIEDAISHFKKALRSKTRGVDSLEMLGHCCLAKGDAEGAINHFWQAHENSSEGGAKTNLKYEIAAAYESAGDEQQAVGWFRACYGDDPNHRDVRARIERLGVDPDADPGDPQEYVSSAPPSNGSYPPHEETPPSSAPQKKNKISYI
jgi:tetratricopeptide (TPR) repeat protein